METCKSVEYFLGYSGFKSRLSLSMTLYNDISQAIGVGGGGKIRRFINCIGFAKSAVGVTIKINCKMLMYVLM